MPSILNQNQNQSVQTFAKWVKLFAIFNVVIGVLLCLTVSGAVVGIIQIVVGVDLLRSARKAKELVDNQNLQGFEALEKMSEILNKLGTLAKYLTIANLVILVLSILGIIVFFGTIFATITGGVQ